MNVLAFPRAIPHLTDGTVAVELKGSVGPLECLTVDQAQSSWPSFQARSPRPRASRRAERVNNGNDRHRRQRSLTVLWCRCPVPVDALVVPDLVRRVHR